MPTTILTLVYTVVCAFVAASTYNMVMLNARRQQHRGDRTAVIEDAFYHLTSRKPDPEEVEILVNLYEAQHQEFDANPADANALLEVGYAPISLYENPREHAAATVVINAIMNMNESLIER